MAVAQYYGTGRRKTSVARVRLVPGQGNITVNKKELNEYIDKLNEKEKWRNLSDYGYSVTDSTLKEAAENAGLHETAFEFQQRVEFRNELINEKIKKIKEED